MACAVERRAPRTPEELQGAAAQAARELLSRSLLETIASARIGALEAVVALDCEAWPDVLSRNVAEAIRSLHARGAAVDLAAVYEEAQQRGLPISGSEISALSDLSVDHHIGSVESRLQAIERWDRCQRRLRIAEALRDPDLAEEDLRHVIADAGLFAENRCPAPTVNAAVWLATEPTPSERVLDGLLDAGDKGIVVGGPKLRKTYFAVQAGLSLAAGRDFLGWITPKPRRVLIVQLEVKENHFHRRLKRVASALNIEPWKIGDRLHVINGRGAEINFAEITAAAKQHKSEVIIIDPLYKLVQGDENAAVDVKPTLAAFDRLAEETGAAVIYIHHDPKGHAGSRNIRDRGAGTNTLVRDCDLLITLTEHQRSPDMAVVATLSRNYPPKPEMSVRWDSGAFVVDDTPPVVASKSGGAQGVAKASLESFLPDLRAVLNDSAVQKGVAVDRLRQRGLTKDRSLALISLGLESGEICAWDKCYPRAVWVGSGAAIEAKIAAEEALSADDAVSQPVKQEVPKS